MLISVNENKRTRGTNSENEEKRPWADLLEELMENIMGNLFFVDQACVRAVCKRWKSIRHVRPKRQIPWLLLWHTKSLTTCKLYDPCYKKTYLIRDTGIKDTDRKEDTTYTLWESKKGWLLISHSAFTHEIYTSFFLYNPFSNERVELPKLNEGYIGSVSCCATFSYPPTSPNCVVFIMRYHPRKDTIEIKTCHPGNKTWTTSFFSYKDSTFFPQMNVVYMNAKFYCFDTNQALGIFDLTERSWIVFPVNIEVLDRKSIYRKVMVETDGELLLIPKIFSPNTAIYKLDLSQMKCVKIESLGDRVVFAGPAILVSGSEKDQGVEDRIYFFRNSKPEFHSLKYHQSLPATSTYGGICTEGSNVDSLFCWKECKATCGDHCNMTWIEPPL
ncbi:hypothetical protein GIB67_030048 [Kingdonia uniflora]|uniref:F-box domain-containing protein n=1 Tax=Kingdonia uniflora TaxID=39325 RepID=A0A7J7MYC9_9MAGN|nr:hypothetical protein GIB67_030048 [Kingdonia uniflora]